MFCCYKSLLSLVATVIIVYHIYTQIIKRFLQGRTPKNLKKMYGEGWALVTGATDGIGKGFCEELATRGFNVCVFGRNQEKTQKVCQEIQKLNNDIKVKPIIADFVNCIKDDNFVDNIKSQLKSTIGNDRVAILVNNVGIQKNGFIREKDYQWYKDIISVNIGSQVLMTKLVTEEYMVGQSKQAIVNVSSFVSEIVEPGDCDYNAAKTFNDIFSRACSYELQNDKIDIISIKPLFVTTAMTQYIKGSGAVKPQVCAKNALNHLGETRSTNASLSHKLQSYIVSLLPEFYVAKIMIGHFKKMQRRAKRKAEQQKKQE